MNHIFQGNHNLSTEISRPFTVASWYSELICLTLEPPSIYLHEHLGDDEDEDVDKFSMHSSMFEDGATSKPE